MDSDEEHKVNESNITVDYERLKEEMSELYGKDALKIHCQETRTELAFTEWRDKHRPVTWPAMPLNMSLRNWIKRIWKKYLFVSRCDGSESFNKGQKQIP